MTTTAADVDVDEPVHSIDVSVITNVTRPKKPVYVGDNLVVKWSLSLGLPDDDHSAAAKNTSLSSSSNSSSSPASTANAGAGAGAGAATRSSSTAEHASLAFIDHVVYVLHETFDKPRRMVKKAPFVLKEQGWGEFTILIEIHFATGVVGRKRASMKIPKPVVIAHDLAFEPLQSSVVYTVDIVGELSRELMALLPLKHRRHSRVQGTNIAEAEAATAAAEYQVDSGNSGKELANNTPREMELDEDVDEDEDEDADEDADADVDWIERRRELADRISRLDDDALDQLIEELRGLGIGEIVPDEKHNQTKQSASSEMPSFEFDVFTLPEEAIQLIEQIVDASFSKRSSTDSTASNQMNGVGVGIDFSGVNAHYNSDDNHSGDDP